MYHQRHGCEVVNTKHYVGSYTDEDDYMNINDGLNEYGAKYQCESCIPRVHEQLRKVNEKAYVPEVVVIGPYHRRQGSLKWMEKQKFRYLYLLVEDSQVSLDKCVEVISGLIPTVVEYYDEPMEERRLVEMVVLDGCFIIQLVRKFSMPELIEENDPVFKMDWVLSSLQRDLVLLENQIPFQVLCKLFDLIEAPNCHNRLIYFVFKFFSGLIPGPVYGQRINEISAPKIKHLLELVHQMWLPRVEMLPSSPRRELIQARRRFHSATDLLENGVRFKRLEKASQFDIKFVDGVLWMPPLTIEERTESFLRNLMAFEQYSSETENLVTAYIKLLDFLIDSPGDVEVLSKYGVIDNWLGDSHEVHRMFKKINSFVTIHCATYPYAELYHRVNGYCSTSVGGIFGRMRRSLFRGSLAVIWVTVVLTLLLSVVIITATQTVYTARSQK